MAVLADALVRQGNEITVLTLMLCDVGRESARVLARALESPNCRVTHLDLHLLDVDLPTHSEFRALLKTRRRKDPKLSVTFACTGLGRCPLSAM